MAADHTYEQRQPGQQFYRVYMAHNHHMRAFAAMMIGRSELALASVREMVAEMPTEWLQANALAADGWYAMPIEVLMRFGRWEEILAEPEPPAWLPLSRALRHYARGVALAASLAFAPAKTPLPVLFDTSAPGLRRGKAPSCS